MSKKFRAQASSSRAAADAFGAFGSAFGAFGGSTASASSLSFVFEPPDLSTIHDANVVVAFKNLLKKDSITKAKALEDLQDIFVRKSEQNATLEDGFLEAWVNIYPRLSIDTSRRVRQLAHSLHGVIVSSAGKRIARHIPRVIGAWIAGLYDNDKPVQRAAQDSFLQAFTTDEKRQGVWKVYQSPILDFVEDAVLAQKPHTLSDERSTRTDDMLTKHARVVGTAVQTFNRLLARLNPSEIEKNSARIQALLADKQLWTFAHHDDSFVRRCVSDLLRTVLSSPAEQYLDWTVISSNVLSKSLSKSQTGSSLDFSNLLITLTERHSSVWTSDYSGKTSAYKRLCQYVKKGSEGASQAYWHNITALLQLVPKEVLCGTEDTCSAKEATQLAEAIHDAIQLRDESRLNYAPAWTCYITTTSRLVQLIAKDDERLEFVQKQLLPLLEQYVNPVAERAEWNLPAQTATELSLDCFMSVVEVSKEADLVEFWKRVTAELDEAIKISAPEQSSEYKTSQDAIQDRSRRFFTLGSQVLEKMTGKESFPFVSSLIKDTSVMLLQTSINLLKSRNGKPYGAAAVIADIVAKVPIAIVEFPDLDAFLAQDIPEYLFTPSGRQLTSVLFSCREKGGFAEGLQKSIDILLEKDLGSLPAPALLTIFSSLSTADLQSHPKLQDLVKKDLISILSGSRDQWDDLAALLNNPASHGELSSEVVSLVVGALAMGDNLESILKGLLHIFSANKDVTRIFAQGDSGFKLISRLLFLSERAEDELADTVLELKEKLESVRGKEDQTSSALDILQQNFGSVDQNSLSVYAMVDIALAAVKSYSSDNLSEFVGRILPSPEQWEEAIRPFLAIPPNPSEAVINSFKGLAYLVGQTSDDQAAAAKQVPRDSQGLSSAARLAFYSARVLEVCHNDSVDEDVRKAHYYYVPLAIQLIDLDISIKGSKKVLLLHDAEALDECVELATPARSLVQQWVQGSQTFSNLWQSKVEALEGASPRSYYVGETAAKILAEKGSWSPAFVEERLKSAKKLDNAANPFALAVIMACYKDAVVSHQFGIRICNELVADLTSIDNMEGKDAIRKLAQLELLGVEPMAKVQNQRIVILVKRLVEFWEDCLKEAGLSSAVMAVLASAIQLIKDLYGTHWTSMFEVLKQVWDGAESTDVYVPTVHASLRLFRQLQALASEEDANDDLADAYADAQKTHPTSIVHLLENFGPSLRRDQPRNITADLLSRTAAALPAEHIEDTTKLFNVFSVENKSLQHAAYDILSRTLPKAMEELALAVALDEKTAELPKELLGLVSVVPPSEALTHAADDDSTWAKVRSYFLGWKAIFNLFAHASVPVKQSYARELKEGGHISSLLNFIFDFIEQPNSKFVDASKYDVRLFEFDQLAVDEREGWWFAIHIYYACLKYVPSLSASWWSDSPNRIKGRVETWTEKYISPAVIQDALKDVQDWVSNTDQSGEELKMDVKVSFSVSEIVASIEVDEDSPASSISISLPAAYPLRSPTVQSRARVAISETKWQSWLRVISGVARFQGSLIDALLTFRKNLQGALKGQTECAICYSIVSPSMRLPNKRCSTCRNTFHSDCLYRWFKSSNASSCPLCRTNFVHSG